MIGSMRLLNNKQSKIGQKKLDQKTKICYNINAKINEQETYNDY